MKSLIDKRNKEKQEKRNKRKLKIRSKLKGSISRPRLSIFKSNKYIYLQLIDDENSTTLISCSTFNELKGKKKNTETALELGKIMGKKMIDKEINTIVFDRNGYIYHGIVKAVADGIREIGIKF